MARDENTETLIDLNCLLIVYRCKTTQPEDQRRALAGHQVGKWAVKEASVSDSETGLLDWSKKISREMIAR